MSDDARWNGERCNFEKLEGNRCILRRHVGGAHAFGSPRWETGIRNSRALLDIMDERMRQVGDEGWTAEHDDEHGDYSMAIAAACYALPPGLRQMTEHCVPWSWPWDHSWWKPKDRRRDLVRAAALIIAEIERLDRSTPAPEGRP